MTLKVAEIDMDDGEPCRGGEMVYAADLKSADSCSHVGSSPTPGTSRYYVYVLRSKRDGEFYIGMTSDLDRRIRQHNSGQTKSTRLRAPFELLLSECAEDRARARVRERYYKSGSGRDLLRVSFGRGRNGNAADLPAGRQVGSSPTPGSTSSRRG